MRKILGNPALEAAQVAALEAEAIDRAEAERTVALENLSLEEHAALLDEANDCAEGAAADLQEVDRVTEVSDALEDLALIAGDIKEPTEGEVALMGNAAQMAVAGTDVSPEEVVPALESIDWKGKADEWKTKGGDFAARVKAKAKEIWERIMAFLKRIWEQIQEFFYRIFDSIPRLQKVLTGQLKELMQAKTEARSATNTTVKMTVGFNALAMQGKVNLDNGELAQGFDSLGSYCDYVFGKYVPAVKSRGEALAKEIGAFTWEKAIPSADAVAAAALAHKFPAPTTDVKIANEGGGYKTTTSKGTIGGLQLVHKTVSDEALHGANSLRKLELLRGESVSVNRGAQAQNAMTYVGSGTGTAYEITALSAEAGITVVKSALDVLKKLESWKKSGLTGLKETQKKLESASSKAAGVFSTGKAFVEGQIPKDLDIALYRASLNFNTAYTKWSSDPAVTLTRSAIASCRALSIVVEKSLAAMDGERADRIGVKTAAA